jgi:hypothetical protein
MVCAPSGITTARSAKVKGTVYRRSGRLKLENLHSNHILTIKTFK